MTNFRTKILITAVFLTSSVASANHHAEMHTDDAKTDKKPAMEQTMSMDEKRMMMKNMTAKQKHMFIKNMPMNQKKMLMEGMTMEEKAMMMDKGAMGKEHMMMKEMSVKDKHMKEKHMVQDGMHPSKVNDTPGEFLQDAAKDSDDSSRAIAMPGSSNTITTATCPMGTTAQTNGTCLITGDYNPS